MAASSDCEPFRLLDLPQELQDRVYKKYFEDAEPVLTVYPGELPRVSGLTLTVESVSKKVHEDAHRARDKHLKAILRIEFGQDRPQYHMYSIVQATEIAALDSRCGRLSRHVTTLELHGSQTHLDLLSSTFIGLKNDKANLDRWEQFLSSFPSLRHFYLNLGLKYEFFGEDSSVNLRLIHSIKLAEVDKILRNKSGKDRSIACTVLLQYCPMYTPIFHSSSKPELRLDFAIKDGAVQLQKEVHNMAFFT